MLTTSNTRLLHQVHLNEILLTIYHHQHYAKQHLLILQLTAFLRLILSL